MERGTGKRQGRGYDHPDNSSMLAGLCCALSAKPLLTRKIVHIATSRSASVKAIATCRVMMSAFEDPGFHFSNVVSRLR